MKSPTLQKNFRLRYPVLLANSLRQRRADLFNLLIDPLPSPVKILDVGGTPLYWEKHFTRQLCDDQIEVTVVNLDPKTLEGNHLKQIKTVIGDARNLKQFRDREFDVVFSNSVIEHVGNYNDQHQMAEEVMRVGSRYFIQTPNLYFPIEPHFGLPLFQFLPTKVKVLILTRIGRLSKQKGLVKLTQEKAVRQINSVKLLSKKDFMNLFPNSHIWEEKFWILTKSFVVYNKF